MPEPDMFPAPNVVTRLTNYLSQALQALTSGANTSLSTVSKHAEKLNKSLKPSLETLNSVGKLTEDLGYATYAISPNSVSSAAIERGRQIRQGSEMTEETSRAIAKAIADGEIDADFDALVQKGKRRKGEDEEAYIKRLLAEAKKRKSKSKPRGRNRNPKFGTNNRFQRSRNQ